MNSQWRLFATALMFMTRIPVGKLGSGDSEDLAASTQYFPLVGIIVGAAAGLVFWVSQLMWPNSISVVLSSICAVMITGALHEDGLADVADSCGAWTKEKKLDVMRDSRIGTYGGLALILAMLLSVISLLEITNSAPHGSSSSTLITSLILAHVLGRWSSLALIYTTNYTRDDAANKVFVEGVNKQRLLFGSLTTLLVLIASYAILSNGTLMAAIGAVACILISRWWFVKTIGGITGDCLGAANKLVEISVYLSIAAAQS